MKNIILIISYLMLSFPSYAQNEPIYLKVRDTYVLKVEIIENLYSAECPCSMLDEGVNNRCDLVRIKVKDILVQRDTTLYSANELIEMEYLVIKQSEKAEKGIDYTVFCKSSATKKYIVANTLDNYQNSVEYKLSPAYLTGLNPCNKPSILVAWRLLFSFNKQKTSEKVTRRALFKDVFLKFINND